MEKFLENIAEFDENTSCLIEARYVKSIVKAVEKISDCQKAKSLKDIIKNINEINDLLLLDNLNVTPLDSWSTVKENAEKIIPLNSSLEEAEKFTTLLEEVTK